MKKTLIAAVTVLALLSCTKKADPGHLASRHTEHTFTVTDSTGTVHTFNYLLHVPAEYGQTEHTWPLLLSLHGAGERGGDIALLKKDGLYNIIEEVSTLPFIVLKPQAPRGVWWSTPLIEKFIMSLVESTMAGYSVDTSRVYLTGVSMGGYGTWHILPNHPHRFAAAMPMCGGGDPETICKAKNVPVWAFHGDDDPLVPFAKSQEMVDALNKCGGNATLTTEKGAGHGAWVRPYNDPETFEWLLGFSTQGKVTPDPYEMTLLEPMRLRKRLRDNSKITSTLGEDGVVTVQVVRSNTGEATLRETPHWTGISKAWKIMDAGNDVVYTPGKRETATYKLSFNGNYLNLEPSPVLVSIITGGDNRFYRPRLILPIKEMRLKYAREITCRQLRSLPVIDGTYEAEVWNNATLFDRFVRPDGTGPLPVKTEARIGYGTEGLYVFYTCEEPLADSMVGRHKDGEVWVYQDDNVEVCFDVNLDRKTLQKVIINYKGRKYESIHHTDLKKYTVKAAAGVYEKGYTVEELIPWKAMDMDMPEPGRRIGFNLIRSRQTLKGDSRDRTTQWAPTFGGNNLADRYGVLVFE